MKAAQINAYGGSEVVEINVNAPKPALAAGQVMVEVHAAGVNPFDWKVRQGYVAKMIKAPFPLTIGGDFSGVVVEVAVPAVASGEGWGTGVSDFKKGDEVYGQAIILNGGSGSFAELASANAANTGHKPRSVNHAEAAALPLTGVSAVQAIIEHIGLAKGQKILIHGGAGGIGTYAIQLARHIGAYVATTAGADDIEYVKKLGADDVIDYQAQRFEDAVHDYDAVFDTVGGETYVRSYQVLKKGGIIVSMLEQPKPELMEQYGVKGIAQQTRVTTELLTKLAELVDQGVIKSYIDKVFPLEQTAEALGYLEKGHPKGKVVIEIKK